MRIGSVIKHVLLPLWLLLMVGFAQAHTNSVGYTKNGNDVIFWYGSWHNNANFTEGSMRLTNNTTGAVQEVVFDQLTCQQPAGLVAGVNYFQSNATDYISYEDRVTNGTQLIAYHGNAPAQQSFCWQGATFNNLPNGDYTFEYIPIANPTDEWSPFDEITRTGTVSIKSQIGLALDAVSTNRRVALTATLKNTGTEDLNNLSVPANLDAVFGAGNYQVKSITSDNNTLHNAGFDGSAVSELVSANQTLVVGETRTVTIVVDVKKLIDNGLGLGRYEAQWEVSGKRVDNEEITDLSTNGFDPDPEGDGAADNQDKTPININVSELGLALSATAVGKQVSLTATLKNTGTEDLNNLSVPANLDAVFGAGTYQVKSITSDNGAFHKGDFDGSGVVELVAVNQNLDVGGIRTITIEVDVTKLSDPNGAGLGRYQAQWEARGTDVNNVQEVDLSTNGLEPDPEGDGAGDNQDLTLINLNVSELGLALSATAVGKQVSLTATLKNTGTQNVNSLSIPANLDAVFGAGAYQVKSITSDNNALHNVGFNGSGVVELVSANQTLAAGETRTVTMVVDVKKLIDNGLGLGRYQAQWEVGGTDDVPSTIKDLSTNGLNPDPEEDGSGDNRDKTPITIEYPELGLAQKAIVNGQTVDLQAVISNLGNMPFNSLSSLNSLDDLFGKGAYRLLKVSSSNGIHNPNYNGSTNTSLLLDGARLGVGDKQTVMISVIVDEIADRGDGTALYESQMLASVLGMSTMDETGKLVPVNDLSTDGESPDPEGDGAANNFERTPIRLVKALNSNTFEISKVANVKTVRVGDVMVWTITIKNTNPTYRFKADVTDTLPPSLSYVANSAKVVGQKNEPAQAGNQLTWSLGYIEPNQSQTIQLVTRITPSATLGKIKNLAQVFNNGLAASARAEAFVEIVSEPIFDCSDVIGKVFEDDNRNGIQDVQERGVAGVQLYTLNGLRMTTDAQGRYHVPCAAKPNGDRGSNLAIKLDERGIAEGYELTTDNPLVQRATKGKMIKFNFGVARKTKEVDKPITKTIEEVIEEPASAAPVVEVISPSVAQVDEQVVIVNPVQAVKMGDDQFDVQVEIAPQIQGELRRLLSDLSFYYDLDSSKVKADEALRKEIERVVAERSKLTVYLDGYTDRVGTDQYNQLLSGKRTASVQRYLTRLGFDTEQVDWRITNHGEYDLPVPTADGVKEPKNRLVKVRFEIN